MKIGRYLKDRAKEGSTYAGLATAAVAIGAPQIAIPLKLLGMAVAGGLFSHKQRKAVERQAFETLW